MIVRCSYQKLVPIEDLIPNPKNSNSHPPEQIIRLAKIMDFQGWRYPIKVSKRSGFIVSGHGRLSAAKLLGWTQCPVDFQDYTSDEQELADLTADNEIARWAEFDRNQFDETLKHLDPSFDIELYGVRDIVFSEPEPDGDPDSVPDIPVIPKSKLGDLWTLGNHRLLCGDSTDKDHVTTLMEGEKADMVFTDPPYRIETEGGCKVEIGRALRKQGQSIEFISDFDPKAFLSILPLVFERNKMNAYIFCNKELLPDYLNWARECKYSFNVLIWKKPNAIPIGGSHRPDIEYMLLFRKSAIWNNGLSGVNYSRCLEYGPESGLHPTMKPVEMLENEIKISSNTNSLLLDLFGGSGSTLIACEKTNRKCFMMELDPVYIDVILQRWADYTKQDPVREDGMKWSELKIAPEVVS